MKKFQSEYTGNPIRTHVYKEIERAIFDGDFEPGTSLTEIKLSQQLGVSRTPVREALMQLELEGLIKNIPGKGAVVVGVTESDIYDIYVIRTRIEGLAARKAAEHITDAEILALEEIVELQEFYLSRKDHFQVWHLDTRFHELLYDSCRSRPLRQMLSLFHNYIQKARETSLKVGRAVDSTAEHRAILEAIRRRDPDESELCMARHVNNARDSFFAQTRETEGDAE